MTDVTKEGDERATPPELFAVLDDRFRFTIDAAASAHNAKLPRYFDREIDGLAQSWEQERVFCNPPYSNIRPWVRKAATSRADLVVMLVPATRTEQPWWQEMIEPWRDRVGGPRVEFLPGRIRFLKKGETVAGPGNKPKFGCCLLIWGAP